MEAREVAEDGGEFVRESELCVGDLARVEFAETVEFETLVVGNAGTGMIEELVSDGDDVYMVEVRLHCCCFLSERERGEDDSKRS